MDDPSYKTYLKDINVMIFDVDGVLTNGSVTITSDGELLRTMNIKDGYALKVAIDSGLRICIISGGSNEGVKTRLHMLGVSDIFMGVHDKLQQLKSFAQQNSIDLKQALYMGDDIPDVDAMQLTLLPCAPQDAVPEIKAVSKYISHKKGGDGCVRDIIEQVLKIQGNWPKMAR